MSKNKYPEETINLILDVSQRLFLEKGYEHTTVQDIINNLGGLTKGAIYHHFHSKEAILHAVINRLFSENSLSVQWEKIKKNASLSGAGKLKAMLLEAITDEQEQAFRKLGINLQNAPQILADLVVRQVKEIAPRSFEPVIQEGIKDGSISAQHPKELSEVVALLSNVWINPLVFPADNDEIKRKFELICKMMLPFGVDVSDMYLPLAAMNRDINNNR